MREHPTHAHTHSCRASRGCHLLRMPKRFALESVNRPAAVVHARTCMFVCVFVCLCRRRRAVGGANGRVRRRAAEPLCCAVCCCMSCCCVVACCAIKVAYVFELLNRTTTNEPFARVDEEVLADFVQVLPEYPEYSEYGAGPIPLLELFRLRRIEFLP